MLFYLKNGPVTLEANCIWTGTGIDAFLFRFLWFPVTIKVMTTDKFVYLFGRDSALSLVLSMVFWFVPRFDSS